MSYNSIRPRGEKLKTFGGTASGHEPIKQMFEKFDLTIKGKLSGVENIYDEEGYCYLKPINLLDIACSTGENVQVGGVRRTALMISCDEDDNEIINAKKEYWLNPLLSHRSMSNNSIFFKEKPTKERLQEIMKSNKINGEPGFLNGVAGSKRRPNFNGVNPCGEILLDNKGLCNLTTINAMGAIRYNEGVPILDMSKLEQMQRLSVRASIRMTLLELELENWNFVHKRDVLVGASITGWKDAMDALNYNTESEVKLLEYLSYIAREEAMVYCTTLRIPLPLLITTVKPEGTLSQVANGVSSGLHTSYAPYYIRRIRINSNDPLVKAARELGWTISPEVGQDIETARTLVIDFPVKSTASKTSKEQTAIEQLENYFRFQESYTDHNSSITIYVGEDEWDDVTNMIYDMWDDFIGVSFLPKDNGTYELAPYEEITKEKYEELTASMEDFDVSILQYFEYAETMKDAENMSGCDTGACPVF